MCSCFDGLVMRMEAQQERIDLSPRLALTGIQAQGEDAAKQKKPPPGRGDPMRASGTEYSVVDMESDALCWIHFAEAAAGDIVRSLVVLAVRARGEELPRWTTCGNKMPDLLVAALYCTPSKVIGNGNVLDPGGIASTVADEDFGQVQAKTRSKHRRSGTPVSAVPWTVIGVFHPGGVAEDPVDLRPAKHVVTVFDDPVPSCAVGIGAPGNPGHGGVGWHDWFIVRSPEPARGEVGGCG